MLASSAIWRYEVFSGSDRKPALGAQYPPSEIDKEVIWRKKNSLLEWLRKTMVLLIGEKGPVNRRVCYSVSIVIPMGELPSLSVLMMDRNVPGLSATKRRLKK